MYWYIRQWEDSPRYKMIQISRMRLDGRWDGLSGDDRVSLVRQMSAWNDSRGRNLYVPNRQALKWFMQPVFIKWIFGGNRSGKTATCAMDVVMQCEGWHPLQRRNLEVLRKDALDSWVRDQAEYVLENKLWLRDAPIEARCVAVDFPNGVEKFAGPAVRDWFTKGEVKADQISNDKKRRVVWENGSFLEFMSHDQDLDAHGGTARDVVWFDEESPLPHYQENLMRVMNGGRLVGGMTAVKGLTWTQDQIWDKQYKYGDKDIYAIEMSTYENPVLTRKAIKRIEDQCVDQEEIDVRLKGKRVARGGLVWKEYRPRYPWLVDPFDLPKDEGYLLVAIDPHLKTEHAAMWAWVDFKGEVDLGEGRKTFPLKDGKPNIYLVSELFEHGTIPAFSNDLRFVEMRLDRRHEISLCDPSAWVGDQRDNNTKTTAEQFEDEGIYPIKGSKDLTGGIHKTRMMFQCDDTKEGDHPRLMIFKGMERTIWEMAKYRYPDMRKSRSGDERAPIERPLDKDDHMMENMRRLVEYVWDGNFEVYEPKPEEGLFVGGQKVDVTFQEMIDEELFEVVDANLG